MRACLLTLLLLALVAPPVFGGSGQAQPSPPFVAGPTTVEAEEIAYDPATGMVTASGNVRLTNPRFRLFANTATFDTRAQTVRAEGSVRLIDTPGREMRADRIVYDIETQKAIASNVESLVGFTYLRAQQVDAEERVITGTNATVTTCDPARPIYRVTAQHVTLVPGVELVARHASLWLGGWRVITLPVYRMSLRPGEAGPNIPRLGYNPTDGYWIDYTYGFAFLPDVGSDLYLKYGQRSGTFLTARASTRSLPQWRFSAGRNQSQDAQTGVFHAFTHGEAGLGHSFRFGGLPLTWSANAAGGWFEEGTAATRVSASRLEASLQAVSEPLSFASNLRFNASASYRLSAYSTGNVRHIIGASATLDYRLGPITSVVLGYSLAEVRNSTPFLFDAVTPTNTVGLTVYYFPEAYQLSAGISRDFAVPKTVASAGVAVRVSPNIFLGTAAAYNLTSRVFDDIDYLVEYRCDCLTVAMRFRQVRRELWLDVSLRGVSERLSFQFQR